MRRKYNKNMERYQHSKKEKDVMFSSVVRFKGLSILRIVQFGLKGDVECWRNSRINRTRLYRSFLKS